MELNEVMLLVWIAAGVIGHSSGFLTDVLADTVA